MTRDQGEAAYLSSVEMMRRVAYTRLEASDRVDDVLQDGFVAWLGCCARVRHDRAHAYLACMVQSRCVDEFRRARRVLPVGPERLVELGGLEPSAAQAVEHKEHLEEVLGDIGRLPETQRRVVLGKLLDGFSHEKLAQSFGLSVDQSRSLLKRAQRDLRATRSARAARCTEIRSALRTSRAAGVRPSELVRRHLWSCAPCRAHDLVLRGRSVGERAAGLAAPWVNGAFEQLVTNPASLVCARGATIACVMVLAPIPNLHAFRPASVTAQRRVHTSRPRDLPPRTDLPDSPAPLKPSALPHVRPVSHRHSTAFKAPLLPRGLAFKDLPRAARRAFAREPAYVRLNWLRAWRRDNVAARARPRHSDPAGSKHAVPVRPGTPQKPAPDGQPVTAVKEAPAAKPDAVSTAPTPADSSSGAAPEPALTEGTGDTPASPAASPVSSGNDVAASETGE